MQQNNSIFGLRFFLVVGTNLKDQVCIACLSCFEHRLVKRNKLELSQAPTDTQIKILVLTAEISTRSSPP